MKYTLCLLLVIHPVAANDWVYVIYPWGYMQPDIERPLKAGEHDDIVNACRRQALEAFDRLRLEFTGTAMIDPETARIQCQGVCGPSKLIPGARACDFVYKWTGTGEEIKPETKLRESVPTERAINYYFHLTAPEEQKKRAK